MRHLNTIIIGGGQAGLATSYYLKQHQVEHVVFEQAAQAGNAWRNSRYKIILTAHAQLDIANARADLREMIQMDFFRAARSSPISRIM